MDKIQDTFENAPENLRRKYPFMPDITIATNGILKLLGNLKIGKASGLDEIKPVAWKNWGTILYCNHLDGEERAGCYA